MRISAYNNISGSDDALTHNLVADTTADIREVNATFTCKVPDFMLECGGCTVVGRRYVVKENVQVLRACNGVDLHLFPRLKSKHTCTIMSKGMVNFPVHVFSCRSAQYLFRKCSHFYAPLTLLLLKAVSPG